jgi:hypothetical protein
VDIKRKDHSRDLCIDGRIIMKWIFMEQGVGIRTGFIRLRIGTGGGLFGRR